QVKIVRLIDAATRPDLANNSEWQTVWTNLAAAGISAIPILNTPPTPTPAATAGVITDMSVLLQSEEELLNTIRAQNNNTLPANLVAVDVFNEPRLLEPQGGAATGVTTPALQDLANTIRANTSRPVFVGGWMNGDGTQPPAKLANQACQV